MKQPGRRYGPPPKGAMFATVTARMSHRRQLYRMDSARSGSVTA